MKKLMIAAAIVCAAALSQAGVVKWGSGEIAGPTAKNQVYGYLFEIEAAEYQGIIDGGYTASGEALSKYLIANYDITDKTGVGNGYSKGKATISNAGTKDATGTTETPKNMYAVLIYKDTVNDLYMGNVAMASVTSGQDYPVENLVKYIGGGASGTATAWVSDVPEPTSGLLLLLGIAGLALRRRRA